MSIDERGYESRALGPYMVADGRAGGRWYIHMKRGGSMLGIVDWYAPWKKFVFQPEEMTEFSDDCLRVLSDFLVSLNKKCQPNDGRKL